MRLHDCDRLLLAGIQAAREYDRLDIIVPADFAAAMTALKRAVGGHDDDPTHSARGFVHGSWPGSPEPASADAVTHLARIRAAILDEGRNPAYHRAMVERIRDDWPTLWAALFAAVYGDG